ncbi:unnamed protein product [Aspergillus oryzae]|nr:unnamed protein product [Aspergillus oryzae]GMF96409.1 unnamed protein product [Aspergillus oryzae]
MSLRPINTIKETGAPVSIGPSSSPTQTNILSLCLVQARTRQQLRAIIQPIEKRRHKHQDKEKWDSEYRGNDALRDSISREPSDHIS